MKRNFSNTVKNCLFTTFLLVCSGLLTVHAKAPELTENIQLEGEIDMKGDDVVGRWLYTVADVAYEYSQGALYITEDNGIYQVEIHVNKGTLHGQEIKVAENKITFNLQVEGSKVAVALWVKGDKLSGESSSADGVFKIEGNRKSKPQ